VPFHKLIAYVDDVAILTSDIQGIRSAFTTYENFSLISGLILNIDKTEILNLKEFNNEVRFNVQAYVDQFELGLNKSITICGKTCSIYIFRESGWQSGIKLEFYPSNPGSTPARVKYPPKKHHLVCLIMTTKVGRKAYLKKTVVRLKKN